MTSEIGHGISSQTFHALSPEQALRELGSQDSGLTTPQAGEIRDRVGPNRLPPAQRKPAILRFLAHFKNVLIYILLVSAVITAFYREWVDFWVIIAVAVGNAVIGFVQEGQAEKALAGIRSMLSVHASVLRDGEWQQVDGEDLVPGDVVRLGPGDKVPADLRLLDTNRLAIDESALTGESEPSDKHAEAVAEDAGIGDRTSIAHSGTVVTRGTALGVVVATGSNTEIGRIQSLVDDIDQLATPLTEQMDRLGKHFALGILVVSAVMMLIAWFIYSMPTQTVLSSFISFAVATVPEGLPALVTITLALGVQQMARHKAITRTMTAVETLGAVTTICSDKTGTLTRNEMTARVASVPGGRFAITGEGYTDQGTVMASGEAAEEASRNARALARAVVLCNDASLRGTGERIEIVGEPTEAALAIFGRKAGFDAVPYTRLGALPFDSSNKYMAVLSEAPQGEREILVKGAPDRLLQRCSTQLPDEYGATEFDPDAWERANTELASQGLRVLAAARKTVAAGTTSLAHEDLDEGLEFVGLVGLVDPPREEAITAVASCHGAGINVKMITGDHAETARAISRELGLSNNDDPVVVTGAQVEAMTKEELVERVTDVDVFARTSPEHKIRIVDALQARREVVAMTGDGVNDAPALTRANVGIAMGIKGTEATKEAADIVLADDNFATIEGAVHEGRRIYDNIRKSVVFLLPTSIGMGLVVLAAVLLGSEPPLRPTQILWVNLVTAITLSITLAYEPAEPGIMQRRPRDRDANLLPVSLWLRVVWVAFFIGAAALLSYRVMSDSGATDAVASTTAVSVLVLGQIFVLFNSRFLHLSSLHPHAITGNKATWISTGILLAVQMVFTYAPFMNAWFGSAPLGWAEWGFALLNGVVIFLLVELIKAVQNRGGRGAPTSVRR